MTGHVNDHKLAALQALLSISGGNIDDLEQAWLITEASNFDHVNGMWREVFQDNGATADQFNTAAAEFLAALGFSGDINQMWHDYWAAGGGVSPPVGPWEYATLALAESSGDPWVNGDEVQITGGALFLYISNSAKSGYSGLMHKYPWDGTGVLGTLIGATVLGSESEGTDPDSWTGWTDTGTGTKGVDYDYDTTGGLARVKSITDGGRALLSTVDPTFSDNVLFRIMDKWSVRENETAGNQSVYMGQFNAYSDGVNVHHIRPDIKSGETLLDINHTNNVTFTQTTLAFGTERRLFLYLKAGRWAVWNDADSTPELSGTVPRNSSTSGLSRHIAGRTATSGVVDETLGVEVYGRMTTA